MLKIVSFLPLYLFCFFVCFQPTIYASANKRKILAEDSQSKHQLLFKKDAILKYYMRLNDDIVDRQNKIMNGLDMMQKSYMFQKKLVCSRNDKVVSPLKKKHKLRNKVDCRSIESAVINKLKKNYVLKRKEGKGSFENKYGKEKKYILKKGKIVEDKDIGKNKRKQNNEKKLEKENIECISSTSGKERKKKEFLDCRQDGVYTDRFLQLRSPKNMKNTFSGKKLFALKTFKKKEEEKKVFDNTCYQLRKCENKKVESLDKPSYQLKKWENRKVETLDKTCQSFKKGGRRKDGCNTANKWKVFDLEVKNSILNMEQQECINNKCGGAIIDYAKKTVREKHIPSKKIYVAVLEKKRKDNVEEDEGEKNVVEKNKVAVVSDKSIDCSLEYMRVNEEGTPEPFKGFPKYNDIRVCDSIYCSITSSSLVLSRKQIADLSPLIKLVHLKHLVLAGCSVSDFSLLSNLLSLDYLDLSSSSVNDIKFLRKLVNLRFLNCGESRVSDITPLSGLVNLEYLILRKCPIVDISPLSGLLRLTYLFLEHTRIEDITPLSNHVNLKLIDLSSTLITNISPLGSLGNLEEVLLADCDIISLSPIKNLNKIVRLDLSFHEVIDLTFIKDLWNLRILDLSNTNITTCDLISLSKGIVVRKTLEVLYLNSCTFLTDLCPLYLFDKLEDLSLSFSQGIKEFVLGKISSLTKLSLRGINLISDIDFLLSSKKLKELDISECVGLKDIGAVCNLPELKYLNVSKCPGLFSPVEKAQETLSLFSFVNNLRTLDVSYNNIDPADIKKMKDDFVMNKSSARVICNEY